MIPPLTIELVEEAINKVYLLADPGVLRILFATVTANLLTYSNKPIWLLFLGASSGGKTALLQLLDRVHVGGKNRIHTVDTLTTATFASGLQRHDEETSLLHRAQGGLLVFKDFTTLTSMNEDGLREIMGQFRAIYDGSFDKLTGNGNNVNWVGRIGVIAGGTIAVQRKLRDYSSQGERFINYILLQPDRKEMTRMALRNQRGIADKENELKDLVNAFINQCVVRGHEIELKFSEEEEDKLIDVADFSTLCRTAVSLNKKTNKIEFVHDSEMPARMATMLINLGIAMGLAHTDGKMDDIDKNAFHKTALDSIPIDRRRVLQVLTKYKNSTTKSLAIQLGLPTDPIHSTCEQLAAIKIIERIPKMQSNEDGWQLKSIHRDLMSELEKIEKLDETLEPTVEQVKIFDSADAAYQKQVDEGYYKKLNEQEQKTLAEEDWGGF